MSTDKPTPEPTQDWDAIGPLKVSDIPVEILE